MFAVMEWGIFKYILPASDNVTNVSINDVIRYTPRQHGLIYERNQKPHSFNINDDGWNSTIQRYKTAKNDGVTRIAIVGDSYVHADGVGVNKSFANILEQSLKTAGHKVEVYRFGIDGAPLSQYVQMIRKEVVRYKPDLVVVQLIHNDFDETYRFMYGRYKSSFLKLDIDARGHIKEQAPEIYKPGTVDFLKKSRTFRYFFYQTGLAPIVRNWVNIIKGEKPAKPVKNTIQSAVDIRNLNDDRKLNLATAYVFKEFKKLSDVNGFKLLLSMDGVREAVYEDKNQSDYVVGKLNKIAKSQAEANSINFIDLYEGFLKDFRAHKIKFNFDYDWHWDLYGHKTVASLLAQKIEQDFLRSVKETQ